MFAVPDSLLTALEAQVYAQALASIKPEQASLAFLLKRLENQHRTFLAGSRDFAKQAAASTRAAKKIRALF